MSTKQFLTAFIDSSNGRSKSQQNHRSFQYYMGRFLMNLVIVTALILCYVEIGHNKDWYRAEKWYTCLHTHHHFFWQ